MGRTKSKNQLQLSSCLMTVREAADFLNVSAGTIYAICQSGTLPHLRIGVGRGTIRIRRRDLIRHAKRARQQSPASEPLPPKSTTGGMFKHLDGERLLAAWQQQGVRVPQQDGRSARTSES
jgi:excisionase family DNA binding protein